MVWGVNPLVIQNQSTTSATFKAAMDVALEKELLKNSDLVVQTAGTITGVSGSTDFVKVVYVSTEG